MPPVFRETLMQPAPLLKPGLVLATALALVTLTPLAPASTGAAPDHVVDVYNFGFTDHGTGTPVTLAVVGDVVEFRWVSGTHTAESGIARQHVTALGDIDSGNLDPKNPSASWTATAPGAFTYTCKYHANMQGVVIVQEA